MIVCALIFTVSAAQNLEHQFSFKVWLSRYDYENAKKLGFAAAVGAAGVGGLVGTGFVIKKIVRVAKEVIALKKQLQLNPKDMSLRKKRRALIGKAIGLGIGGLVLGLLSGAAVGLSAKEFFELGGQYSNIKGISQLPEFQPFECTINNEQYQVTGSSALQSHWYLWGSHIPSRPRSLQHFDYVSVMNIPGRTFQRLFFCHDNKWYLLPNEIPSCDSADDLIRLYQPVDLSVLTLAQWQMLGLQV
jgi:hypothetical protein